MCMVNFNFACEVVTALQAKNWTYISGSNSIVAIDSKGWWQMLQHYKPLVKLIQCYNVTRHFEMCVLRLNLPFKDDTALQAKNWTYMSETKTMAVTDL